MVNFYAPPELGRPCKNVKWTNLICIPPSCQYKSCQIYLVSDFCYNLSALRKRLFVLVRNTSHICKSHKHRFEQIQAVRVVEML